MMRRALTVLTRLQTLCALTAAMTSALAAQDYARIAPKTPARAETLLLPAPEPLAIASKSHVPLGVTLKALIFVTTFETAGVTYSTSIDTARVSDLDDFRFAAQLQPFLKQELTLGDLDRIKTITLNWLRAHQRPFAEVTIPPQNISSGTIQIVVTEYRLGKIEIAGARYFSPSYIERTSGLQPGQTLRLDDLQSGLDRLNRNPFLNVDAVFQPGAGTSQTDVKLQARDQFPLRLYSGYDNLGTRSLGIREYNAGANWGNAFGTGQIVSYQFTRSVAGAYNSHSISDAIPLRWGDQLLIFGSYATEHPSLASIFKDQGHSGQASARYVHQLPRFHRLTQEIEAGYDFKTTDNNLEFAGFRVFGALAEVDQFPLIYDGNLSDHLGQTAIQNTFVYSPGRLTPGNTTEALSALVPGARAAYLYNRFLITRTTPLPRAFTAITRVTLQQSDHNLPYSEQVGGGGVGSVRGYYTDTAFGSRGALFSQELRLPAFSPAHYFDRALENADKAQFGVFFDYADLRQVTAIPDVKSPVQLASAGFLARYSTSRFFDVQLDTGRRLHAAPTVPVVGWYSQISLTGRF